MISIIIPTYRREELLKAAILSAKKQSSKDWEIIVIDNDQDSSGSTSLIIKELDDSRIRYYHTSIKGCTNARNFGADKASSEVLLFIDDDIEFLHPSTFLRLEQLFAKDPSIGIIGAIELSKPDCNPVLSHSADIETVGKIFSSGEVCTGYDRLFGRGVTEVDHVRSAFLAIPKNVYCKVGGVDRAYDCLGYGFRAETDFCMKVKRAGYKVVVDPQIIIWHKVAQRKGAKFSRGKSISYSYYANRNHFVFMNRFFWRGKLLQNFKAILWGTSRPMSPGRCLYTGIRYLKPENLVFLVVSLFAAVKGFQFYHRFDRRKC